FNVFIQEKAVEVAERLKKNRTLVSPEKASLEELRQECSELQKERQDAENLKQEAANLGKILHTKRTEILELVRKLNKLENDMTNLEQQLREKQEKAREERESVRNELTKKITDLEKLRIEDQGKFDLLELERDAEIRSKQTQLNEKDGIIKNREKNLEQNTETSADNHRLTTELREKTEELRNAIRQKRIVALRVDLMPVKPDSLLPIYPMLLTKLLLEINKLQELREELKEVRGKLLQAQLAARKYIEKCPHRNPQGQCPQCNLAQSFGYPSTSQEKNHSEILSKVRKILVVDPSSQAENSTIVEQPVNEDAVPFKIIQEEKPD
ncbi:31119_t:CDS:2, partial [Racocetra persica]